MFYHIFCLILFLPKNPTYLPNINFLLLWRPLSQSFLSSGSVLDELLPKSEPQLSSWDLLCHIPLWHSMTSSFLKFSFYWKNKTPHSPVVSEKVCMWHKSWSLQMLKIFVSSHLVDSLIEYSRLRRIFSQNFKTWLHFFSKGYGLGHSSAMTITTIPPIYIFQKFIKVSYSWLPSLFFYLLLWVYKILFFYHFKGVSSGKNKYMRQSTIFIKK